MKNETILKKSIEKAVKNGFDYDYGGFRGVEELVNGNWDFPGGFYYSVIFSHSFAKAFWGEEWEITNAGYPFSFKSIGKYFKKMKFWQYHLQQMVLEPKPLKYLERYL